MHTQLLLVLALVYCVLGDVPLGCNLNGVSDGSTNNPFIDVVKQSRFINLTDFSPFPATAVDVNGWPLEDFGMVVYSSSPYWSFQVPETISGTYVITFVGPPTCIITPITSGANVSNVTCNGENCGAFVTFYSNELSLAFNFTDGKVKNITMFKKGMNPDDLFDPNYIAAITPFAGVLRFMNWQNVARSMLSNWSDRALVTDATWTRDGVPYEIQILFGNTLNRDIWVNIPIAADQNFVYQLAVLVKSLLKPNLNVYVENADEVWNPSFTSYNYNKYLAIAEVQANPRSPLNFDNCTGVPALCDGVWAVRRSGWTSMNFSVIFATVFGEAAINDRVRVVLGVQADYPPSVAPALNMIDSVFGPPNKFLYALAGGGYLNLGEANNYDNMTTDSVLEAFNETLQTFEIGNAFEGWFIVSRNYSLKYVGYEGGIDTFGPNGIDAKRNASLDPRISYVINSILDDWFSWGFSNFNWFMCDSTGIWETQWGSWGLLVTTDERNTVKWETAVAYVSSSPSVTAGSSVDSLVPALNFYKTYAINWPYWIKRYGSVGNYSYTINSPVSAEYDLSISFANNTRNYSLGVYVKDTDSKATIDIIANVTDKEFVFSTPVKISLNQGINLLILECYDNNAYSLQYMSFTRGAEKHTLQDPNAISLLGTKQRMLING